MLFAELIESFDRTAETVVGSIAERLRARTGTGNPRAGKTVLRKSRFASLKAFARNEVEIMKAEDRWRRQQQWLWFRQSRVSVTA